MGRALELITGRALNPGAAQTALTPNTGDSFAVKSFPFEQGAAIEGIWTQNATAGTIRVRSPRLHDNAQGIRFTAPAALIRNFLPDDIEQRLFPQDALTIEMTGGGAETDVGAVLLYYNDLPGVGQRLYDYEQLKPRIVNVLTQEVVVTPPGTAGDWSAGTAINATFDLLKANVDYAVLGYDVDVACAAFAIRGPDTGNLRVGGPGPVEPLETRDWFVSLNRGLGKPCVPVINAANKGATLAFVCKATAAGNTTADLVLAELSPGA